MSLAAPPASASSSDSPSASASGTASLSSSLPFHLEGHTEWITSSVLLSDSRTLVTGSLDTTIKLWNLKGAANASASAANAAAYSDVATPASPCLSTLHKHGDYIQSLSYCPWNQMVVSAGLNFELYSWRVDAPGSPRLIDNISGGGPDANPIATGSADYGVHEFDQLRGSFYSTAMSENGNTLITGSSDEIVRLYDTRSLAGMGGSYGASKNWLKLLGHTDNIRSVALQERVGTGLSMAYSSSCDGTIRIWDLRAQRCVRSCSPGAVHAGRRPLTLAADRVCDLRERLRLQAIGIRPSHPLRDLTQPVPSVPLLPCGSSSSSNAIWCMVVDSTCTKAFTGGAGPVVWVTDLNTGESQPVIRFHLNQAHPTASAVLSLALDEPRGTLWVGTWDGAVTGWNVTHCLNQQTNRRHTTTIQLNSNRMQYLSDESLLSRRDRARVLDSASDDVDSDAPHGTFPLLLSSPTHALPLAPLTPIERVMMIHDRVHVIAAHINNTVAFDPPGAARADPAAPSPTQIISTWNIIEGTCIDVARVPAASGLTLELMGDLLNAEFGRRVGAMKDAAAANSSPAPSDKSPPPTHKLVPNWCTLDARLGCISVNFDRRQCFTADLTSWFRERFTTAVNHTERAQAYLHAPIQPSARFNLGEVALFTLLSEWSCLEDLTLHLQSSDPPSTRDGRLLRPLPPSSKWIAGILFPNTTTHDMASSTPIIHAWTQANHQPNQRPSSSTLTRRSSAPTTESLVAPPSGIGTSLTLFVYPPRCANLLPSVLTLPLTCGPSDPSSSTPAGVSRARQSYAKHLPAWIEGIVFAPGANPAPAPERDAKTAIELETQEEGDMWLQRSKAQAATPTINVITPAMAKSPSLSHMAAPLHPPRTPVSTRVSLRASREFSTPAGRSEDLSTGAPLDEFLLAPPNAASSSTHSTPSRRASISVIASPRYAPQALAPTGSAAGGAVIGAQSTHSATSSNNTDTNQRQDKIQFQLLPLVPSQRAGGDTTQRRLFGDGDGDGDGDGGSSDSCDDDHDDVERRRDALRMSGSRMFTPLVSSPLPLVGSGSLVVPAGLTVRRVAAYLCQRLWKNHATRHLLPNEMTREFERQHQHVQRERQQHTDDTATGIASATSASPASADVASGIETKPQLTTLAGINTPNKTTAPHTHALTPTVLTPGVIHATFDTPSVLRRTISFSTVPCDPTHSGAPLRPPHSPSLTACVPAPPLSQPEHFIQLLLWNPATNSPYILSPDLELGSVRDSIWPKMRRAALTGTSLAVPPVTAHDRRNSVSAIGGSRARTPSGATPGLLSAIDANSASPGSTRLMLIYYHRSPAGEDWYHHASRHTQPASPPIDQPSPATSSDVKAHTHSVPRILHGVQTATNLRVAVPMVVSTKPCITDRITPPATHSHSHSHSHTLNVSNSAGVSRSVSPLPVSSPQRPRSAARPNHTPRPAAPLNPRATNGATSIISRHQKTQL